MPLSPDIAIPWSEEFVVQWTKTIADTLGLQRDGAWVSSYGRPKFLPSWVRAPFLSYSDISATNPVDNELKSKMHSDQGRTGRVLSLSSVNDNLKPGDAVVMRMQLADLDHEGIFQQRLHSGCRNRLRKARKAGLTFYWLEPDDNLLQIWPVFVDIYKRLGSPLFPQSLISALQVRGLIRIGAVFDGKECVAVTVVVDDGRITWIPWCGARTQSHNLNPNHITYWEAILHALNKQCSVVDFGRSAYDGGTYHFKRKWGTVPVPIVHRKNGEWRRLNVNYAKLSLYSKIWKRIPDPVADVVGSHLHCLFAL